jgi:hypothetical protein
MACIDVLWSYEGRRFIDLMNSVSSALANENDSNSAPILHPFLGACSISINVGQATTHGSGLSDITPAN